MQKQTCTRCIMDNDGDSKILFSEDGTCNYCNNALRLKDVMYFPNEEGEKKLQHHVDDMKRHGKGHDYDCIVGVSGGLDSSYVVMLGHQYGLRMLCVHIDDGLDSPIAIENMKNLCEKAKTKLLNIKPDMVQYKDITLSFLKAAVPNVAIPQDNLIFAELHNLAKKYDIKYSLSGYNFSMESILQKGNTYLTTDTAHIRDIHSKFGTMPMDNLHFMSSWDSAVRKKSTNIITLTPLNFLNYSFDKALEELAKFSNYNYYGGKHYESILTRFMQCFYLPVKYNSDKRKSHLSSLIISEQLTREDALKKMAQPLYDPPELKDQDFSFLANYFDLSIQEFEAIVAREPKSHDNYKKSFFSSKMVPLLVKISQMR